MQPLGGGGRWLAGIGRQNNEGNTSMRKQLLAGAMAVALATMMTTSAMASNHGSGGRGSHGGGFHASGSGFRGSHAGIHGAHGRRGGRYVRGYGGYGDSGRGPNFIGLGISGVGIGLDTGEYGCSPTDKAYIGGFCGDYVPY
jgi:hypothetical protein